jgi:hypothetical protein
MRREMASRKETDCVGQVRADEGSRCGVARDDYGVIGSVEMGCAGWTRCDRGGTRAGPAGGVGADR